MSPLADPVVAAFEAARVPEGGFGHRRHLYVAWCYLSALPLEEALARYTKHLKALASALGAPEKYHATMTWAYLLLLDEAMRDPAHAGLSFDELALARPDLLDHARSPVYMYYTRTELAAPESRERFVLPRSPGGVTTERASASPSTSR
jgi:N-formylglutamate deformylase